MSDPSAGDYDPLLSVPRSPDSQALSRRTFIGAASGAAVTAVAALGVHQYGERAAVPAPPANPQPPPAPAASSTSPALAEPEGSLDEQHLRRTERLRVERAAANAALPIPAHPSNGDEQRYANKIGSDTRGLPHNARGEVDLTAWAGLIHALKTRDPADFERVKLGGTRKLQQPLGTLALNLVGISPPQFAIPPAPALASAERAADAIESYWKSLLRDVPFHEYRADTKHPLLLAAAAELSQLPAYTGPRDAQGKVTPELLFRGSARYLDTGDVTGQTARSVIPPGVLVGPHISQFILKDIPYGSQSIPGLLKAQAPGTDNDFLTHYDEWLANQDGKAAQRTQKYAATRRYLTTGRDLAEYAHAGSPAFWGAALLLGTPVAGGGLGAPLHPDNPYLNKQVTTSGPGVATFGLPYIQSYLPLSASKEIRANYWQKWFVHRTLRPEAYGGLIHNRLTQQLDYPIHDTVLQSEALARSFKLHGSYLLSSAYPDGAPNHSSYPGGASASAAVNATILKAFFDESFVIPDPVEPDPRDPTKLIPYRGPALTVGGELNKLATNVGQGRNWAGIHFRSDAAASLPHAEEVAIAVLRDERHTFREPFAGFTFSRFDGSRVVI